MRFLTYLILLTLLISCSTPPSKEIVSIKKGTWLVEMDIEQGCTIPFRIEIDESNAFTIVNHQERIPIQDINLEGDSFFFETPRFHSQFKGYIKADTLIDGMWTNMGKENYHLPFKAFYQSDEYDSFDWSLAKEYTYEVSFSPNSEDEYKALGLFYEKEGRAYGTFLTETGDYRFLEGSMNKEELSLSCFDGSHLFLFQGELKNDSIVNGVFNSGKHWEEPWIGVINKDFTLTHPDSLTYLLGEHNTIEFDVQNTKGDSIHFGHAEYQGKVSVVQIYGTWCPNCLDESVFYKELYETYNVQGLEIIPVAFERSDELSRNVQDIEAFNSHIDLPFESYLGGKASKKVALEKFPLLNNVISFPTSIFIDKKGEVRKIHTGFYGPGTGKYYDNYVAETTAFVSALLDE